MKVLLLGGSGFIGRRLAARLQAEGVAVEAPGRSQCDLAAPGAARWLAERLDADTALVFAAALTPDRDRSPAAQERNAAMVEAVARALEVRQARACLFYSSTSVYGEAPGRRVLREDTPVRPQGEYAAMKLAAEARLARAGRRGGTPVLSLRPTMVYGPGDSHGSYGPSALIRAWRAGRPFLYGEGEDERDFLYVDDLVEVSLRALRSPLEGVLLVGEGRAVSYAALLDCLRRLDPRPVEVEKRPRRLPVSQVTVDLGRLRQALGPFQPLPVEEGLRRTLEEG